MDLDFASTARVRLVNSNCAITQKNAKETRHLMTSFLCTSTEEKIVHRLRAHDAIRKPASHQFHAERSKGPWHGEVFFLPCCMRLASGLECRTAGVVEWCHFTWAAGSAPLPLLLTYLPTSTNRDRNLWTLADSTSLIRLLQL
jgi:hypothetical protein